VGNIYADEALFRAGIRPTRLASRLKAGEFEKLAAAIRAVLKSAVRAGGSTIRDYVNGDGRAGRAQKKHAVYGRGGEACVTCGGRLKETRLAQRATVFCTACQK
jgi:formamidopyrimidine-DNA glycosylase